MSNSTNSAGRPQVGKIRSNEEHAALLSYHISQLRSQRASVETAKGPVEEAKAELKVEQDELSTRFDQAQIDLGRRYTRKYLEGLITDGDAKIRDLVEHEKMRAQDKVLLNQPVFGVQPELFPGEETPSAARDEMAWEAEGYQRGLRGDLQELQQGDPPTFHQAIMRGYEQGQKVTRERFQQAMDLKQREGEPDAAQAPVDLGGPELDALDPDAIADEAERLRASGFMETGASEKPELDPEEPAEGADGEPAAEQDGFEASPTELAQQKPRLAVVETRAADDGDSTSAAA